METVRLDRWLNAARIFKSRTHAQQACDGGHVSVNGRPAKAAHALRAGDEIRAVAPRGKFIANVLDLADKRQSAAQAKELYEDRSPPPPPREEAAPRRARGAGRPTKSERRAMERFRRS